MDIKTILQTKDTATQIGEQRILKLVESLRNNGIASFLVLALLRDIIRNKNPNPVEELVTEVILPKIEILNDCDLDLDVLIKDLESEKALGRFIGNYLPGKIDNILHQLSSPRSNGTSIHFLNNNKTKIIELLNCITSNTALNKAKALALILLSFTHAEIHKEANPSNILLQIFGVEPDSIDFDYSDKDGKQLQIVRYPNIETGLESSGTKRVVTLLNELEESKLYIPFFKNETPTIIVSG